MTASDSSQAQPPSEQQPDNRKKKVRFFNVSLRNGVVVSTPSYPEKQAFCAQLIRTIETASPDFAWVQFLFVKSSYGLELIRLKNSLHAAKIAIERPTIDVVSGQERDRRELHRDFYRQAETRMKRIDDIASKPTITMAIQGMWVEDRDSPRPVSTLLPFDHCSDEHDCLAVFEYRDPRMLLELVDRRMVVDISPYLDAFTKSRLEPPSFMVTPQELQSFVHLPAGEVIRSLHSLKWGTSMRLFDRGATGSRKSKKESSPTVAVPSNLVRLAEVPAMETKLEEESVQPLDHLASERVRTLELVYRLGQTEILLSSETPDDMSRYATLLASVYGDLKLEAAERHPAFLRNLPEIVLPHYKRQPPV